MATPSTPYSRKNPFPATLLVNRKLNLEGSEKETRHYEFSLAGSGLVYEVGDSMGVFPQNNPKLVEDLLHTLHFSGGCFSVSSDTVVTFFTRRNLKHCGRKGFSIASI
jgi:sulfite reductase (NADPH) flavoprotein alpha-component